MNLQPAYHGAVNEGPIYNLNEDYSQLIQADRGSIRFAQKYTFIRYHLKDIDNQILVMYD